MSHIQLSKCSKIFKLPIDFYIAGSSVKSDTADIGAGKSNPDKAKATSVTAAKAAATAAVDAKAAAAADEQTGQPTTAQPAVAEADNASETAPAEIGEPDETAPATDAPTPVVVEAEAEADETAAVACEDA